MKKVVIVEDDLLLARHIQRVLEHAGYDARSVHHAPGAIDLIDEFKPDVIVLDVLLGGSTVVPLLNELISHDDLARIPLVVLSSLAGEIDEDTLRSYSVREVLDKATATPDDIVATVGACLR